MVTASDRHPPTQKQKRQQDYIKKHGQPKERRKTLAVTDKYEKVRRVLKSHGGGVGIQTHGNKLAKALNTQTPDHSVYLNEDNYLKGGIKIRS